MVQRGRTAWRSVRGVGAPGVALCAAAIGLHASVTIAAAKLPGVVHCYNDICHRVRTVEETAARRGVIEPVVASYYDSPENDRFNPRNETSSGATFDATAPDNAASPIHPDGTVLLVWSPVTGGAAIVRVNNAGPYYPGRTLDVSRGVAEKIGFGRGGVMQLLTVVIEAPSEPDAHYRRGRIYPKVAGYLGRYDNLALASMDDPRASAALFNGDQPLPALALNSTQQLLLMATQTHMKSAALAAAFQAAPSDELEPPDLHVGLMDVVNDVIGPEEAVAALAALPAPVVRVATVGAVDISATSPHLLLASLAPLQSPQDKVRAETQRRLDAEPRESPKARVAARTKPREVPDRVARSPAKPARRQVEDEAAPLYQIQ